MEENTLLGKEVMINHAGNFYNNSSGIVVEVYPNAVKVNIYVVDGSDEVMFYRD